MKMGSLECLYQSPLSRVFCYTIHLNDVHKLNLGEKETSYSDIQKYLFIIQYTQFLKVIQMIVDLVHLDRGRIVQYMQ